VDCCYYADHTAASVLSEKYWGPVCSRTARGSVQWFSPRKHSGLNQNLVQSKTKVSSTCGSTRRFHRRDSRMQFWWWEDTISRYFRWPFTTTLPPTFCWLYANVSQLFSLRSSGRLSTKTVWERATQKTRNGPIWTCIPSSGRQNVSVKSGWETRGVGRT